MKGATLLKLRGWRSKFDSVGAMAYSSAMDKLPEFIAARRAELTSNRSALQAGINTLLAEVREIDAELSQLFAAERAAAAVPSIPGNRKANIRRGTIKDKIISVLSDCPEGADANKIVQLVVAKYGQEIPRTSLSPQLSRLKEDGWLNLRGKTWTYVDPQDETPPESESGSVSEITGEDGASLIESRDDEPDIFS